METPKYTLADIRGQIDTLDREIIRLIAERQQRVIAAGGRDHVSRHDRGIHRS
jgi:chorismate mutase